MWNVEKRNEEEDVVVVVWPCCVVIQYKDHEQLPKEKDADERMCDNPPLLPHGIDDVHHHPVEDHVERRLRVAVRQVLQEIVVSAGWEKRPANSAALCGLYGDIWLTDPNGKRNEEIKEHCAKHPLQDRLCFYFFNREYPAIAWSDSFEHSADNDREGIERVEQ